MKDKFELAGGSIIGREHLRVGKNNQDAYHYLNDEFATIAVVCDGCGSGIHSEVGAKLGSRLVVEAIRRNLPQADFCEEFWHRVHQDLLHNLKDVAVILGGDLLQTVKEYLLFTIVGAVITSTQTTVFAIGDGAIALNDQVIPIPSFPNNAPPYIAYGLIPNAFSNIKLTDCQFQIYCQLPTDQVNSILIGSDGVLELMKVADKLLPGKSETVGEIRQFWSDDVYFRNSDRIRRRLSQINHSSVKSDWEKRCLRRENGLLADDTTLVVIRNHNQRCVMLTK